MTSFLISLKDFLASSVHFILFSLFNIFVMFFIISEKLGMNLLKKFTCPINDYNSFFLLCSSTFKIASTLSGSFFIPSFEIICHRSFPSLNEKLDFLGLSEIPYFLHFRKTFSKCLTCSLLDLEKIEISSM